MKTKTLYILIIEQQKEESSIILRITRIKGILHLPTDIPVKVFKYLKTLMQREWKT